MKDETPSYLYKYHSLENKPLKDDAVLKALFNSSARFRNRTSFNDLFDSKIHFIEPSELKISRIKDKLSKKLNVNGKDFLNKFHEATNNLLDNYFFYCVSGNNKSILMWSHYADSHKGFCIEFKYEYIQADKVIYQKYIPQINRIELIDASMTCLNKQNFETDINIGKKIWTALRTKLEVWDYEDEYRFQLSNKDIPINMEINQNYLDIQYQPQSVNSIIFGCRTTEATKKFIIENMMPYNVKFKQAIEELSSINIRDIYPDEINEILNCQLS